MSINSLVDPLLTDLYQLTMVYGYWKNGSHDKPAVFDLFFRRCPFGGEFAVFAGLEAVLSYLEGFRFTPRHLDYLRSLPEFADKEAGFFEWLGSLDAHGIRISAPPEGSLVFPRVPLIRLEAPLAVAQILETTLLTLVNYASLVATNAARYRLAAGWSATLLEFGLRRAQGPDGGLSASRYAWLGGFDASSNVKAGELYGIPVAGTHAHAFVESFTGLDEVRGRTLRGPDGREHDFCALVLDWRARLASAGLPGAAGGNDGELAAFIAYAAAFPARFTALVDTYASLESGIPNFIVVAAALFSLGWQARGIRLDSGDLAYLSLQARQLFALAGRLTGFAFDACRVTVSNDINEAVLHALGSQAHGIDQFGIGTNLVTCEGQPAFGGVYKLVEIAGMPRIKLSENRAKQTIPGRKLAWRLFASNGHALADLLTLGHETPPQAGQAVLCRHPFDPTKQVRIIPDRVEALLPLVWDGRRVGPPVSLAESRRGLLDALRTGLRPDQLRVKNPASYKVSLSEGLHQAMQELIARESVVRTLE